MYNRQEAVRDAYQDRYHHWDDWRPWGYAAAGVAAATAAYAVGSAITASAFYDLPCTSRMVYAGGAYYYECGGTWYSQVYSGGDMVYTVVDAPQGY
jgi:hypothetical protein